jgi:hypothetical protein
VQNDGSLKDIALGSTPSIKVVRPKIRSQL